MIMDRNGKDELSPFTALDAALRPLLAPLTRLAATTRVLHWAQSRYRWFNYDGAGIITLREYGHTVFWDQMLYLNGFNDSIPFVDAYVWQRLRSLVELRRRSSRLL
ncbi:hypothetical protein Pcinc_026982 [Petrolisthes cinctipes]|uniref:Uncharacterized protein n=1 Tax=Petrolisthes cinctipes TaxID=88211 RepID=A0AAE1F5W9_PETCI|nr:hypothetical protein Pcinc_026982 [Petrolisthes cinctipes]